METNDNKSEQNILADLEPITEVVGGTGNGALLNVCGANTWGGLNSATTSNRLIYFRASDPS
jgi:hypothetical protein